jgi:hypothetical protein
VSELLAISLMLDLPEFPYEIDETCSQSGPKEVI